MTTCPHCHGPATEVEREIAREAVARLVLAARRVLHMDAITPNYFARNAAWLDLQHAVEKVEAIGPDYLRH